MLGVMLEVVEPALASHLKLPPGRGIIVQSVATGGLADRVGLRVHDILIRVDDETVEGLQSFIRWFDGKQAGNRVSVVVLRSGERKRLEFVLE
jgi:serine protease Do